MDQKPPKMMLSHNTQNASFHPGNLDTFDSSGIKANMTERLSFTPQDLNTISENFNPIDEWFIDKETEAEVIQVN